MNIKNQLLDTILFLIKNYHYSFFLISFIVEVIFIASIALLAQRFCTKQSFSNTQRFRKVRDKISKKINEKI